MIKTIKQGDTYPPLKALLQMDNGEGIKILGATVNLIIVDENDVELLNKSVTIIDGTTGEVEYKWLPSDTATVGEFRGEFEITWTDGSIVTVPNDSYFIINIVKELGSGV